MWIVDRLFKWLLPKKRAFPKIAEKVNLMEWPYSLNHHKNFYPVQTDHKWINVFSWRRSFSFNVCSECEAFGIEMFNVDERGTTVSMYPEIPCNPVNIAKSYK